MVEVDGEIYGGNCATSHCLKAFHPEFFQDHERTQRDGTLFLPGTKMPNMSALTKHKGNTHTKNPSDICRVNLFIFNEADVFQATAASLSRENEKEYKIAHLLYITSQKRHRGAYGSQRRNSKCKALAACFFF